MDKSKQAVIEMRLKKTMEALEKNNMQAIYAQSAKDVPAIVQGLLREGETVAVGGSVTLAECGVMDLLQSGKYKFVDRMKGETPEEIHESRRAVFFADTFLCSSNAITENGELYNVDGTSNRVAPLLFGPKSVIVVAGYNKLCKDLDKAAVRVKSIAAPANTVRLNMETYCHEKGECMSLAKGQAGMACGCASQGRICCNYVVSAYQREKYRVKVILVAEELGY